MDGEITKKEQGLNTLKKYIAWIDDGYIAEFVEEVLSNHTPDYFFEGMASTSGKYHKGETNIEHIVYCMEYGKHVVNMMTKGYYTSNQHWNDIDVDMFYAALLLHDTLKCGPEQHYRFMENGEPGTSTYHPIFPCWEFRDVEVDNKPAKLYPWYEPIMIAIATHYGPWSAVSVLDPISLPGINIGLQVFLTDYVVSRKNIKIEVEE